MSVGRPSLHPSQELGSDRFVESCGAILFDLSDSQNKKVCIVQPTYTKHEWLLAKGRRNYGESRKDAAIREVMEETGFRCKIYPVTMGTHATPPDAGPDIRDSTRVYEGLSEPFWCTIRNMKNPIRTKIIWWYIAVLEEEVEGQENLPGEEKYVAKFFKCDEALERLTYQTDREVVAKAIELVDHTLFGVPPPNKPPKASKKEKATKGPSAPKKAKYETPAQKKKERNARAKQRAAENVDITIIDAAETSAVTVSWPSERASGTNAIPAGGFQPFDAFGVFKNIDKADGGGENEGHEEQPIVGVRDASKG
jgi:8-oxo-dGTP pyrophosphatase MutT (NUDIX family)